MSNFYTAGAAAMTSNKDDWETPQKLFDQSCRHCNRQSRKRTMSDKAMPLGKKFKVRLTITPEETGTPVDMLGFTFTSGRNGRMELDTEYNNIPKLADDGLDSLSILVILKTLEMWAQKGYELFQPIAQRFHGGRR